MPRWSRSCLRAIGLTVAAIAVPLASCGQSDGVTATTSVTGTMRSADQVGRDLVDAVLARDSSRVASLRSPACAVVLSDEEVRRWVDLEADLWAAPYAEWTAAATRVTERNGVATVVKERARISGEPPNGTMPDTFAFRLSLRLVNGAWLLDGGRTADGCAEIDAIVHPRYAS